MEYGVQLIDVTLRDGGYVNGHAWPRADAVTVVTSCAAANIAYCEVGYFRPRRHAADGERLPAACCPPDYLRELRARAPGTTLVTMVHGRDVESADYQLLADEGVGMVRLPAQLDVVPSLPAHVTAARAAGLRVAVNLIRASEVTVEDAVKAARLVADSGADVFYLADSNGSMFPEDVTRRFDAVRETVSIPLGFHAHDGLSLAFINSLAALRAGCEYLDASLAGMGKGGGNLSLELIVGYLHSRNGASFSMVPLAHTADTVLAPWRPGAAARCESMASGLLDLNIDGIAERLTAHGAANLVSLVDAT